nr:uncharacterized mitochondrial protein AtMg00810-like [Tanacetum cinerariifolium]
MIMPSKDTLYNGRKGIGFENPIYFGKAKDLRPSLYDEKVIGLGYTPMFLIHLDEALEIEKFKRARENKIEFAYDYRNLNASYVNEKINFSDYYFQKIINLDFEKIDSPFQQTSSLKPEKECDKVENSKVIAPGMLKLSVSQSVSPILMSKTSRDSKNVENKTKRKRHLDTFSSVRRPKQSSVIWKKKGSSNTYNVDLSSISHSKLNKDVKRYSRKDLLSCNNSHLGETSSAYVCNDAMNVSCNSRLCDSFDENNLFIFDDERETRSDFVCNDAMNVSCNSRLCDSFDENNLFIFDDESVRISPVSKMPFRKKPHDSMNVRSKSNSNKSLPRTVYRWLPKMQPLAEPVAKWIPRVERQIDKISKTPNSSGPIFKWVPKVWLNVFGALFIADCPDLSLDHRFGMFIAYDGSTNLKYCTKFSDLMVRRFEMSMMGEMKFFLGLQVNQFSNGTFINQSKYILDILKRFGMENCDTVPTPMVEQAKLKLDLVGKPVDHTDYQSMIGSLMYVTSSRPDIMFATCMCARYQANPNEHHVSAIKRIFRYLKGTIKLGLWYPKDSGFDLTAYSDADHTGCHLDRKSKYGSVQFLGDKLVCWSSKK